MPNNAFSAIIAAAGSGKRFGGVTKKQFLEIHGKPIYLYSLETFLNHPAINEIILVIQMEDKEIFEKWVGRIKVDKPIRYVQGGSERYLSVKAGLEAMADKNNYALIHDAARALLSERDLNGIICMARTENTAVLPCMQIKDTIKRFSSRNEEDFVEETIPRVELASATTPQCIPSQALLDAYAQLETNGHIPTDDTEIYQATGKKIKVFWHQDPNPKLTVQEDFDYFEYRIKKKSP